MNTLDKKSVLIRRQRSALSLVKPVLNLDLITDNISMADPRDLDVRAKNLWW